MYQDALCIMISICEIFLYNIFSKNASFFKSWNGCIRIVTTSLRARNILTSFFLYRMEPILDSKYTFMDSHGIVNDEQEIPTSVNFDDIRKDLIDELSREQSSNASHVVNIK